MPFDLNHPIWIEDPDFDLDWHLRHIAVPRPGGIKELSELVGHLVAMPLDRSRPLWEVWLIDGLEGGHVAALSKVHHAAIDGASGEELIVAILDITPEIEQKPAPDRAVEARQGPDRHRDGGPRPRVARPDAAARREDRPPHRRSRPSHPREQPPAPTSRRRRRRSARRRTSFNAALTPHRAFATATLSLPDVKLVKNAFGATVNDVVLALCAGALRNYLDHATSTPTARSSPWCRSRCAPTTRRARRATRCR